MRTPLREAIKTLGLTLSLALASCQATLPTRTAPAASAPPRLEAAQAAAASGQYVIAAREYERLARLASVPERQDLALKSVEMLLKAAQLKEARERLAAIDVRGLDPNLVARKRILTARLASQEGRYQDALALLARAQQAPQLDPALIAETYRARADTELALGRPVAAIKDLAARESYMADRGAIMANEQQIWQIAKGLDPATIARERAQSTDPLVNGWLDLAKLFQEYDKEPPRLASALAQWKATYPAHPANQSILAAIPLPTRPLVGRVERIALLLPLTSEYALQAQALRDGFVAMQAADATPGKPTVHVYDTGKDPAAAAGVYAQAVRDGAQFVVGPLGIDATDTLVKTTKLDVPTLLLSHTSVPISASAAVFQFGLPPGQEARQAAERAFLDHKRMAAVLYPDNSFGTRMQTAFSDYWQRLGGTVVASQAYTLNLNDYTEPVKRLLDIDQSEQRRRLLEQTLGMRVHFEPRPRQDVDVIFLAADARHGRLIKPQLNYYRVAHIPVYSTSHIFSGHVNRIADLDLDGVRFGDMPWMLVAAGKIAALRAKLQGNWPYAHTPLDRLYALGIDAYAVIPQLDRLTLDSAARFRGVTSGLSVEPDGRLHRQLLWAKFRRGVPTLIDTFLDYRGLDVGERVHQRSRHRARS